MKRTTDVATLILRIAAGAIFIPHGYTKVFAEGGIASFAADMPSYGIPALLGYVVPWAELAGGTLLIVGLLTRLDAFLLACTMGVAAFVVQLPDALHDAQPGSLVAFVVLRGIETPLALFAVTVALVLLGPGRLSLDALLGVERRVATIFRKRKAAAEAAAVPVTKL
jgi:putative oxidoreductase